MELSQILQGIKVVELASVLAGPLAGSFLAELGADVVKIENGPAGGDVTRNWKLPEEANEEGVSAYYHSANYGKKICLLDLKSDKDKSILYEYCKEADVILSNYQKNTAQRLGVDLEKLRNMNPNAILVQLNAFEYDDPRPGYDLVMQAETGFISMCGHENELAKMPVAMIDILAAHQIKEAVLIGLMQRNRTGQSSVFHVSLYKSAVSALVNQGTNFLMAHHVAKPMGTLHPNIAPYGEIIQTADGVRLMLAVGSEGQFAKLANILGLSEDKRIKYETNHKRVAQRDRLQRDLQNLTAQKYAESLVAALDKEQIPFARVRDLEQVLTDTQSLPMILPNNIEGRSDGKYISNLAFSANFIPSNENH